MDSITGDPQYTHALDEAPVSEFYSERPRVLFDPINKDPLVYSVAAHGSLRDRKGTQDSQVNSRGPMPPNLSLLRFSATENHSERLSKRSFDLDIERTLAVMGNVPAVSKIIPASTMDEARTGAIFLHFLNTNPGSSTDILTEWKMIACKELWTQLQIHRVDFIHEDKFNMLSQLCHFGYLIAAARMEIWEMKVQFATSDKKEDVPLPPSSSKAFSECSLIPVAKEASKPTIKAGVIPRTVFEGSHLHHEYTD